MDDAANNEPEALKVPPVWDAPIEAFVVLRLSFGRRHLQAFRSRPGRGLFDGHAARQEEPYDDHGGEDDQSKCKFHVCRGSGAALLVLKN